MLKRRCRKEYLKEYRNRPCVKQHLREYSREYENTPQRKAYKKEYYQRPEVREHLNEYYKKYNDTPKMRIWRKKYERGYKSKRRLLCRKWHKNNRNYFRVREYHIPLNKIQLVYEDNIKKFGTLTCYLCLKPIQFGNDALEHKIPVSRGGTHEYENLEVSCKNCNSKKSNKTIEEYLEYLKKEV